MGDLKVGVVGLGLGRHHVAAYAESEAVGRLVVCDPDAVRVAEIKQAFPEVGEGYANLEAMLEKEAAGCGQRGDAGPFAPAARHAVF